MAILCKTNNENKEKKQNNINIYKQLEVKKSLDIAEPVLAFFTYSQGSGKKYKH